jgi:O-antigen ligase
VRNPPALLLLGSRRADARQLLMATGVGCGLGAAASVAAATRSPPAVAVVLALLVGSAVALLGDLRRVLLGLALLDIPFQWYTYLGYREDVEAMAGFAGFSVSVTTVALVGLYVLWIGGLLVNPEGTARVRLRPAAPPLAFLGILGLSLLVAGDRTVAGFQLTMYLQALLLFVYVASTVRTTGQLRFVVTMLLVGVCLESLVALAMLASGGSLQLPGLATRTTAASTGGTRIAGTIGSPNNAGAYFAFMFSLSAGVYLSGVRGSLRRLAVAGAVLAGISLVLTLSRGAWIACAVSIIVLLAGSGGRQLHRAAVPAFAIGVAIVLVPLYSVFSERLLSSDHGAAEGRVPLIHMALQMIMDHPFLGVGANNFVLEVPKYATGDYSSAWLSTVHHKYLLIWSEGGIGALIAFLVFLAAAIVRGWRLRHAADPLKAGIGLGLAAAVIGHAVHMNFELFAGGTTTQMLWLAAGLLASPSLASGEP